jgi:hypothetical protein
MGLCIHYDTKTNLCNKDGNGCKLRINGNKCAKNGQLEEKTDDFRLKPVDRIAPW